MKNSLILLVFTFLIFGCNKDTDTTDITQTGPFPVINVESSLTGIVTNEDGVPLEGADVAVAGQKLKTNNAGLFFVHKKLMNKNGEWVKVSLNGYVNGGKFAFQNLNNSNFLKIILLSKYINGTVISSSVGGTVNINGGGKIDFPEDAFVNASGQPYSGNVSVYHRKLTTTDKNIYEVMPGDLRATDKDGNARLLKTFGMLNVELIDQGGNKLNLAPGKSAKITLSVPSQLLGNAPNKIPLWHFNQENGLWVEEGTAELINGSYEGYVTHFSFWNCDLPTNYIKLSGCIADINAKAIQGMRIEISSTNWGISNGYTDDKGLFGGYVPSNENLILKLYDQCGIVKYSKNLGSLTSDTDLGKITIALTTPLKITGKLLDCNGIPLSSGLIIISNDTISLGQVQGNSDGTFEMILNNCQQLAFLTLTAYDYKDPLQSNPLSFQVTGTDMNIGEIIVCTSLDEYLQIISNNYSYIYNKLSFTKNASTYYLSGNSGNYGLYLAMSDISNNIGEMVYIEGGFPVNGTFKSFFCNFCISTDCGCNPDDKMNFLNFSTTGDYSVGTFDGTIKDSIGVLQPVTINFKAKFK